MMRSRLFRGAAALLPAVAGRRSGARRRRRPENRTGDTAWMLASTALVLMMTIPGLALFYAGMVRKKNMLATMMQSFTICCLVTIVWMVAGYSIAFTNGTPYFGDMSRFFLNGLGANWDKPFMLGGSIASADTDDDPRDRLHDVPDDVRDHHAGADRRRVRRPDEVQRVAGVHDAVVAVRLFADRALGVGATAGWAPAIRAAWRGGFRRRHGGAHQRRNRRPDVCAGAGQAGRLRPGQHGAAQPVATR